MTREFTLRHEVVVRAPIERCFLLSTSLAIVEKELRMHPVEGPTTGFVVGGDTVRWEGWQLGLTQFHVSLIENFRPPTFFRDRMVAGRFDSFQHDHALTDRNNGTVVLSDELRFTMPWGWPGEVIGSLVLVPHIRGLVRRRFALLKSIAEGEEWRNYLEVATVHAEIPRPPARKIPLS